jgi:iron complex transport system permease protein
LALLAFFTITIIISLMIGAVGPILGARGIGQMSFQDFLDVLFRRGQSDYGGIIVDVRLPRVLLAGLVGCALAVSGCTMQALFRNPLADPYLLGISSGAAVGASASVLLNLKGIETYVLPLFAFLGGVGAVFAVYLIARGAGRGRIKVETLLLSGIAVGSLLGALTSLMMYASGLQFRFLFFWLLGGFSGTSWDVVVVASVPIIAGILAISLFSRDLNAFLLGEEPAMHLGIDVETMKKMLICLVALITGISVAFSGIIGFVGLVIPHAVRIVLGPDHRTLLPASCLVGGSFLIWADVVARTALGSGGTEIPVGIVTALCGAPFFLYLLVRGRRL